MKKVLIFSGTSEGRELSEKLNKAGIHTVVSVATEYGEMVMSENPLLEIVRGRLDTEGICELIKNSETQIVVDATHPFATLVTENIKLACEKTETEYLRVRRSIAGDDEIDEGGLTDIIRVSSCAEAAEFLSDKQGNILLTTGVKELSVFTTEESLKDRIYARILPSMESLEMAYRAGLSHSQIFALEGPFDEEMNIAFLKRAKAKYLVTKNSGQRGGFAEKITACKKTGTTCIVIMPPSEEGVDVAKALRILTGEDTARIPLHKEIFIAGIGPGSIEYLTVKAYNLLKTADVFIGAERMCDFALSINNKAKTVREYLPEKVAEAALSSEGKIVILVSGDSGFYSGCAGMISAFSAADKNLAENISVCPGISSVSAFASKINQPYSEAAVLSIHGRKENFAFLDEPGNSFVLLGDKSQVLRLLEENEKKDAPKKIKIGFNLCLESEKIITIDSENAYDVAVAELAEEGLYIAFIGEER